MRKFSKVLLSCTAVAALTAGLATSAFADYQSLTASYADNGEVGKVSITCASQDDVKTLLILKNGADLTNFTKDDILQIEQNGTIAEVTVPKMTKGEEAVTYKVYMGGTSGTVYAGEFTIAAESTGGDSGGDNPVVPPTGETVTIKIGDVDDNTMIMTNDATAILWYTVNDSAIEGKTKKVGNTFVKSADSSEMLIGDVDNNGMIMTNDATAVLWYTVNDSAIDGKTKNVGNEVTGTYKTAE